LGLRADVVEREQVEALVTAALDEYGQVDGLVNLAYFHEGPVPIAELPTETLARRAPRRCGGLPGGDAGGVPHLRGRGAAS